MPEQPISSPQGKKLLDQACPERSAELVEALSKGLQLIGSPRNICAQDRRSS